MLGLSLVPELNNTRDLETLYTSNVNHYIVEDPVFKTILEESGGLSGREIVKKYNKTLREDESIFSDIPIEILEEIVLSVDEAFALYKMCLASKRMAIFLSEPYIMSKIREKEYSDKKLSSKVEVTEENNFVKWYFETFFTEFCVKHNSVFKCIRNAFLDKNFSYLTRNSLVPGEFMLGNVQWETYFDDIDAESYLKYANFLYSLAEGQIRRLKDEYNSVASLLITEYILDSVRKNKMIDISSLFEHKKYEDIFISWYVRKYHRVDVISEWIVSSYKASKSK